MEHFELIDPITGSRARIAPGIGFNCFSWQVDWGQGPEEALWTEPGFELGDKRASGSGIPILFPHPGRIAGGEFEFNGEQYSLPVTDGHPNSLHGFVLNRPWEVEQATSQSVAASFQASKVDPRILDWWPSDFLIRAEYTLAGNQLACDLQWRNAGDKPLPYGLGTHTYFRLPLAQGSSAEDVVLAAPIAKQWELVDMLASGKLLDIPSDRTFGTGMALQDQRFDDMFQLDKNSTNVTTTLSDPRSGRRIAQRFGHADFPNLVIYTPGHREAICMEPYSCAADPFRLEQRAVDAGLRVLAPGETASTQITLAAETS